MRPSPGTRRGWLDLYHPDLMLLDRCHCIPARMLSSGSDSLAELGMNSLTLERVPVTEQRDRELMPPPKVIPSTEPKVTHPVRLKPVHQQRQWDHHCVPMEPPCTWTRPSRDSEIMPGRYGSVRNIGRHLLYEIEQPISWIRHRQRGFTTTCLWPWVSLQNTHSFRAACASVNRDLRDADREKERVALLQINAVLTRPFRKVMTLTTGMDTCDEGSANTSIDLALETATGSKSWRRTPLRSCGVPGKTIAQRQREIE